MRLYLLMFIFICSCVHSRDASLDFYQIGKDIHREVILDDSVFEHDIHIPAQGKTIVIILSSRQPQNLSIVQGMRVYYQNNRDGVQLKVMRHGQNFSRLTRAITRRQVHGVITDLPRAKMRNFITSCHEYNVPILYLSSRRKDDPWFMRSIHPDFSRLIQKVIAEIKVRKFSHIALLSSLQDGDIATHFRRQARDLQVTVASYQRDDFESMSKSVRELFDVQEETVDTEEEGRNQVVYRQLRKYDAIFLPDDFKMLKYFVKIFAYYNLEDMPVIGLHNWRSPELLTGGKLPGNGFFVDFIGSYSNLPPGLNTSIPHSLAAIRKIDQHLLGYRGMSWLVSAIDVVRTAIRRNPERVNTAVWKKRLARKFRRLQDFLWQPHVVGGQFGG